AGGVAERAHGPIVASGHQVTGGVVLAAIGCCPDARAAPAYKGVDGSKGRAGRRLRALRRIAKSLDGSLNGHEGAGLGGGEWAVVFERIRQTSGDDLTVRLTVAAALAARELGVLPPFVVSTPAETSEGLAREIASS